MHRFTATIEQGSAAPNSWCYVELPTAIARELGGCRRVTGTIADTAFDGALQSRGGGVKTLLVKRELRDALGLRPGSTVEVQLAPDERPREVTLPAELTAALDAHPPVAAAFAMLAPSHRREYADWIAQAKKTETRAARVERALTMIAAKQRLK